MARHQNAAQKRNTDSWCKVKLCLCLTEHHAMKTYWGIGGIAPNGFLTTALEGGEWSDSHPDRFTPGERAPRYPLDRRLGGSTASLDAVVKRRIPSPGRESNPWTPIVQLVASSYPDWATRLCLKKCDKLRTIPGKASDKWTSHWWRTQEQTEFGESF
jgi:hypothetical protein